MKASYLEYESKQGLRQTLAVILILNLMKKLISDSYLGNFSGMIYEQTYNDGDGYIDSDGIQLDSKLFNKWFEENVK